jgi:tetratricopeptide (TPR) repeat protein
MRLKNELLILAIVLTPLAVRAAGLPDDMHAAALASVEFVFKEDFKGAEEEAKKVIRAYPEHPAGYFLMAASADAWMLRYQSNKREAEFYRYCDQAVEKAEKILAKDAGDDWARFFMGGADGYKGTYEARYERYITAFRFGWKGVSVFLKMASAGSGITDINFGIGTYDYWRSALMKMLWWMPGVDDKREVGIAKLKDVMNNGVYSRTASAMVLIDIYNNEKRFDEAAKLSAAMMKKYPRAIVFQWGYAAASYGLKNYDDAIGTYRRILTKVEADQSNNFYNSVQCRVGMARSMVAAGINSEALVQLDEVNKYQFSKDIKKRLESTLSEAGSLRKKATPRGVGGGDDELVTN